MFQPNSVKTLRSIRKQKPDDSCLDDEEIASIIDDARYDHNEKADELQDTPPTTR